MFVSYANMCIIHSLVGLGDATASPSKSFFGKIWLDLGEIWAKLRQDLGKND